MEPQLLAAYAAGVPIILFLVEAVKQVGLPSNLAPLVSLLLGIGFVYVVGTGEAVQPGLATLIVQGALVGMAASGAYSGIKRAVQPEMEITVDRLPDDEL
jgi:hypothetical protein